MVAVFNTPATRTMTTVSVGLAVQVTSPSDTSGSLYENAVLVGAMTAAGGGVFTYTYTPATMAASNLLTFVGNISGTSAPIIITVREANTFPEVLTSWSTGSGYSKVTVQSGVTPPVSTGNGVVYRYAPMYASTSGQIYITTTLSPAATISQMGFDFWVGLIPGSTLNCMQLNFSNGGGYYNFLTGESTMGHNYINVVEKKIVSGVTWLRIQQIPDESFGATISNSMFLSLTRDFTSTTTTTTASEPTTSGFYIYHMQATGKVVLPFNSRMKLSQHISPSDTTTLRMLQPTAEWRYYKHPFVNAITDDGGGAYPGGSSQFKIIYPPSWTASGNYPLICFVPALSDSTETGLGQQTAWQTAGDTAANYASTYNAVVMVVYDLGGAYWWGKFSNGTKNMADFLSDVAVPFAVDSLGVSPARNDHVLIGYSKSAQMGSISQILLRPDVWGFVGAGDGSYLNTYPNGASNSGFDTLALYQAYNPEDIYLSHLSSVNDIKRIVITTGAAWQADYTDLVGKFLAANVPIDNYQTTWTVHAWGPTGINTGWTPVMVARTMALRAAAKAAIAGNTFFFV